MMMMMIMMRMMMMNHDDDDGVDVALMYSVLHTSVTTTPDRGRVGTPQPTMSHSGRQRCGDH